MEMKTNKEPTQAELIKIAWCDGFNTGFAKAQEKIIFYIKEMGYSVEIPNASELFEKIKTELMGTNPNLTIFDECVESVGK